MNLNARRGPEEPSCEPVVSVVIPTHNRAALLVEAIDSVLQQSLTSFEIIVVDDRSTDDTEARVARCDARVRYYKTDRAGAGNARNIGMRHARGRYLAFLDSDDLLYPYALEIEATLLDRRRDVGLVCAEMTGFDAHGVIERYHLKTYHRSAYRNPAITYDRIFTSRARLADAIPVPAALRCDDAAADGRHVYSGHIFDHYLLNLVLCQNTVMFRRSIGAEVGERSAAMHYWEEVDYLLRITRRHSVAFIDVPTYRLRYHDGQLSTMAAEAGRYVWMRKQQELLRVIKRHALADTDYYRAHRRRIDAQLANLHRAVAVPMLLQVGSPRVRKRAARYALRYLARCARYGRPALFLQLAAHAPAPMRTMAVKLVESCRQAGRSLSWSAEKHFTRAHRTPRLQ